jgi:N-acetyl-gamma-glutamyl-phosphate reductase
MISVGIIGGTGYTGKYLLEFIKEHNKIDNYTLYAKKSAGSRLFDVFPELVGIVEDQTIQSVDNLSYEHDLFFVSLPHGESLKYVPAILNKGIKVIDLGGDFRLDTKELYKEWYKFEHTSVNLLSEKIYGLADVQSEKISGTNFIANPGCYPTSIQLALIPLVEKYSDDILSISSVSYSGTSGAGKSAKTELLLSELDGNAKAYNVNTHRHQPEIEQELKKYGMKSPFAFTTHLLPIARGIYSTSTIHMYSEVSEDEIKEYYLNKYADSKFVRMRNVPPEIKWVVNTNFCDINISAKGKTVVITSTIDNLIKGASGQAVQNMNIMFGWDETLGILR